MNVDLIAFNCRYSHSCLALFYVRAALEKNSSIRPALYQFTINDPYYDTLLKITSSEADSLFFSVYIWNADYIQRLIRDIHKAAPRFTIVLGGPQAPCLKNTLTEPVTVVGGEIEGVDSSFYTDLLSNDLKPFYDCISTPSYDFPYTNEDFESHLKNRNIYYESSRGCPFSCSYCLSSISKGINSKAISTIKNELSILIANKPKIVRFVDRTFNADPQKSLAIWQYLLDHSPDTTCYHFEIAPDIFTEEMFTFLEQVPKGFFQFEIGIQSTNAQTLSAVNRKMDCEKAFKTITRLLSLNTIHLHIDLILGLPFDTVQSFYRSFRDLFKLRPHYIQMGLLKVLPGTGVESSAGQYSIQSCSQPPYQVLSTQWMSHSEIQKLYWFGECFESFHNNRYFTNFFNYIAASRKDYISFFEGLLQLCREKNFFSLAKTQAFMHEILFEFSRSERDRDMLEELLIFDWLSCGHRFLPKEADINPTQIRTFLYETLPDTIDGLFDRKSRNIFLKKNIFYKFSGELLKFTQLSTGSQDEYVAFLSGEKGVLKKITVIAA